MKDLILIFSVAVVFFGCYLAIKKINLFSPEAAHSSGEVLPRPSLCIAFENPLTLNSISAPLEKFSEKYPECQIRLFSGTSEEILQKLSSASLDFGFVVTSSPSVQKYLLFQISDASGAKENFLHSCGAERRASPCRRRNAASLQCAARPKSRNLCRKIFQAADGFFLKKEVNYGKK